MKKILVMLALLMIPIALATSSIDIDLDTTESLDANIDLNSDGPMSVNVNGGQLANKGDIRTGVRGRMTQIIAEGVLAIQDGTLYDRIGVHAQAQIIGQVLLDTFITRGEVDLLYEEFKTRLMQDIYDGSYEADFQEFIEEKERQKSTTTTTIQEETVPTTEELECKKGESVRAIYENGERIGYNCWKAESGNEIPELIGPVLLS